MEISGPPSPYQEIEISTEAATCNPTEDIQIGIETVLTDTTCRTQTDRFMGTDLEVVSLEVATLEGVDRMRIIAELEVYEGPKVTPPPTIPGRKKTAGRRSELMGGREVVLKGYLLRGWGSRSCGKT